MCLWIGGILRYRHSADSHWVWQLDPWSRFCVLVIHQGWGMFSCWLYSYRPSRNRTTHTAILARSCHVALINESNTNQCYCGDATPLCHSPFLQHSDGMANSSCLFHHLHARRPGLVNTPRCRVWLMGLPFSVQKAQFVILLPHGIERRGNRFQQHSFFSRVCR